MPDELDPLVDKIALQIGFLLYAGKPDGQVIADIVRLSQEFFEDNLGLLFNNLEDGSMCRLLVMHPDQEAVKKACCHSLGDAVQEFYYESQEAIKKQNDIQNETENT